MPYPPAALPVNLTNATPQQNTHPTLHNQVSQAINDVVTELGANPSGDEATVQARLDRFEAFKMRLIATSPMGVNTPLTGVWGTATFAAHLINDRVGATAVIAAAIPVGHTGPNGTNRAATVRAVCTPPGGGVIAMGWNSVFESTQLGAVTMIPVIAPMTLTEIGDHAFYLQAYSSTGGGTQILGGVGGGVAFIIGNTS